MTDKPEEPEASAAPVQPEEVKPETPETPEAEPEGPIPDKETVGRFVHPRDFIVPQNSDLTVEQLSEDVEFLANRSEGAGSWGNRDRQHRATGISSNAIVRAAYGGVLPEKNELPHDRWDLFACEKAVCMLPEHRRTSGVMLLLLNAKEAVDPQRKLTPADYNEYSKEVATIWEQLYAPKKDEESDG